MMYAYYKCVDNNESANGISWIILGNQICIVYFSTLLTNIISNIYRKCAN